MSFTSSSSSAARNSSNFGPYDALTRCSTNREGASSSSRTGSADSNETRNGSMKALNTLASSTARRASRAFFQARSTLGCTSTLCPSTKISSTELPDITRGTLLSHPRKFSCCSPATRRLTNDRDAADHHSYSVFALSVRHLPAMRTWTDRPN